MAVQAEQTLAAFVLDNNAAAKRFLSTIQAIDKSDNRVQILDAAIAERTRLGRVKVHQTMDRGGAKGAVRGATVGVIAGAIIAGPAGAAVAGAAGGVLAGLRNRIHDVGIDDKFMRQVGKEVEKGRSAVFVQYEGVWTQSLGAIQDAVKKQHATLIHSTLPPEKATELRALVEPAVEKLGGEEVVTDYEVATVVEPDDLTQLSGIGPKVAAGLSAAGITTYKALAEANEPQIRRALGAANMTVPASVATWPVQASFAAKNDWHGLMKYNQKQAAAKAKVAKATDGAPASATTSGELAMKAEPTPAPKPDPDDLTKINGIGPRLEMILADGEITTYDQLQHATPKDLRLIVAAGGALPPSSLSTWPRQATYAAKGDWQGLATYNSRKN